VFETHSTSVDNERGIATGWLDGMLSETGRTQAVELGARRRDDGVVAVFTSDLGRAVETPRGSLLRGRAFLSTGTGVSANVTRGHERDAARSA
jgi:bisphosphoglycerate-dependent phosphoglycerate mutase